MIDLSVAPRLTLEERIQSIHRELFPIMQAATLEEIKFAQKVDLDAEVGFEEFIEDYLDRGLLTQDQLKYICDITLNFFELIDNVKDQFQILRPYILVDFHRNGIRRPKSYTGVGYSFPSGHAAAAYLYAHLLSKIVHRDKEKLYRFAERVARSRLLLGVHTHEDIDAGKKLAELYIETHCL